MFILLKIAARQLFRTPGFTATAVATLAICIGANLTIFAVVDAILVRSLPFPSANRLVTVFNSYPGAGLEHVGASIPNYFDRRGTIKAFSSVSLYKEASATVGGSESPERITTMRITPEFFATLGVPLVMGRPFTDAEFPYGADQVAILTDDFWRSHFNADANVVGRTFLNDGLTVTVVGVLPANFHFLSSRAEFFRPMSHGPEERQPDHRHAEMSEMVARLAPGATLAEAQAQIDALNAHQALDDPIAQVVKDVGYSSTVADLHEDFVRKVKPMLVLLQCGVLFLLLIGGVNLSNLLLLRASGRAKEFAVRLALGAGHRHVVLDAVAETTLLGVAGGLAGLLVGSWCIDLLPKIGTANLPLGGTISLDNCVAAAALGAAIVAGWLLAAPAIWFNLRMRVASGLKSESRGGTVGRDAQRVRHGFIVAQIALALMLLSGAGLLGLSLKRVLDVPTGFNPANVVTGNLSLPWKDYKDGASRLAFEERLLPAVRALPGVTDVAIESGLPFNHSSGKSSAAVEGITGKPGDTIHIHQYSSASSDYWRLMGIRLLRGRLFTEADDRLNPNVCVVDQAFVDRYWPGGNPIGHRLTPFEVNFDPNKALTIVGVVSEVKQDDLAENPGTGAVYATFAFMENNSFSLIVRSTLPIPSIVPMVRKVVHQLDPNLTIDDVRPMQSRIDESLVGRRSPAILAGIFAAVALLLAAIGTYGVLSYAVGQRQREIGVRMALGARSGQILRQFLALGFRLLATGTVIGILGAWAAGRAMQSILFDVPGMPPSILAAAIVVMGAVTLTACLIPAGRAAKVEPVTALRAE
jgi:predicted permease